MQVAPAEIEDGNIEYKRHFININQSKLNHLTAQMNWRINEGNGICYYYLGVCDNGLLYEHFSQDEIDYSLDILKMMIEGCNSYIDNIIINRVKEYVWLNIVIKRNHAYLTEYRIFCNGININKLLMDYNKFTIKSKDIYYNTVIYNNEKYLFFDCNKKYRNTIEKIIDFNLILNNKFNNYTDFNDFMKHVETNMNGNNHLNDNNNVIFNIIKYNYINSIGHIIFGYLKQGTIQIGMNLEYRNQKVQILSIHNNYIDCTEAIAPATISIRISNNNINININKMSGYLFKKNEVIINDHRDQQMDHKLHQDNRRRQAQDKRRERRRLVCQQLQRLDFQQYQQE
jgi:hypothetical protein